MESGGIAEAFQSSLNAAGPALQVLFQNLPWLLAGIAVGITVGILPGLGGTVGMSVLLPFVIGAGQEQGIALLIGMVAIIHTADTFPSILLGVPGSSGSQATIMDGYPLAKRGQASRALSAAFSASLIGGLIGAAVLFFILPLGSELLRLFGPPERLMIALLGIAMVGVLAGRRPLRGVVMGFVGLLLGAVGTAPGAADFRYSFGILYFNDGFKLAIIALSIFALPEILDLLVKKTAIAGDKAKLGGDSNWRQSVRSAPTRALHATNAAKVTGSFFKSFVAIFGLFFTFISRQFVALLKSNALQGVRDTLRSIFLVIRSAIIGTIVGFIPGLGGSVVDWISYGLAKVTLRRTEKFGDGDIRGVIAPESANNAKEGGALIPTILFSIPGSGATAVLLGGFFLLGIQPGPLFVQNNLDTVLLIVWSLAAANVFGTILTIGITPIAAWVASINFRRLAPFLLVVMVIGSYQATRQWGDIWVFLVLGLIAWVLRKARFPLVPLLIGFVLTTAIERQLIISSQLFTAGEFLSRPGVLTLGIVILIMVIISLRLSRSATANA